MRGLDPKLCTHGIYIGPKCNFLRKPQRRVNLVLKDIVKIKL